MISHELNMTECYTCSTTKESWRCWWTLTGLLSLSSLSPISTHGWAIACVEVVALLLNDPLFFLYIIYSISCIAPSTLPHPFGIYTSEMIVIRQFYPPCVKLVRVWEFFFKKSYKNFEKEYRNEDVMTKEAIDEPKCSTQKDKQWQ